MKDAWSLGEIIQENGDRWLIRKNLAFLDESAQRSKYPICVFFTIHYVAYTKLGFPSSIDNDALEAIEECIVAACDDQHSVFVATVFMPNIKDFILYTADYDRLCSILESTSKNYQQFKFEVSGHSDANWTQYQAFF
jgi:hypothetical protein